MKVAAEAEAVTVVAAVAAVVTSRAAPSRDRVRRWVRMTTKTFRSRVVPGDSMRVGRNDACPCGSGKKFKSCCEGKTQLPKGLLALLAAFAIIAAIAFFPRKEE